MFRSSYSSRCRPPVPKCIVHGAAGTLVQHLKELKLHTDLKREDTIFYYTTCGLWRLAQDEKVSVFGTSAKYLASIEKAEVKPGRDFDLSRLKALLSTGSPLSVESFEYVYRDIKADTGVWE